MLECYPDVNRSQAAEVVGTKVPCPAAVTVIFGRGQAIVEVGKCTPCEPTSLLNPALRQCPFNKLDGLPRLVVVVTGKNDGRDTGPHLGPTQILAGDGVRADPIKNRPRRAAFRTKLFAI